MISSSRLNRKLLFCGHNDLTQYLKDSPLNRYLYKKILGVLSPSGIEIPVVTLFNEIYYQCVRINYDGTPGVDMERRFFLEEESWLKSPEGAQMVFCVVWSLLTLKQNLTFHEECFLSALAPYLKGSVLRGFAEELSMELRSSDIEVPERYPVMTAPVSEIPFFIRPTGKDKWFWGYDDPSYINHMRHQDDYHDALAEVTSNFSHSIIEKYVRLYSNPNDQLRFLTCMETALTAKDEDAKSFLKDLTVKIEAGSFDPSESLSFQTTDMSDMGAVGNDEKTFRFALDHAEGKDDFDLIKRYRQERDTLRSQLEEMQKNHAMEQARLEAKYKAEIHHLRKENSRFIRWPKKSSDKTKTSGWSSKILMLNIHEVTEHVKERFSKSGGLEVCAMLYHLAGKHGAMSEETINIIDSIVPAIEKRNIAQHIFEMPNVSQFNNNPQTVINNTPKE